MAKKKIKSVVGRKNTIVTSIPKVLYDDIIRIQIQLNTGRTRDKPFTKLEAALQMRREK